MCEMKGRNGIKMNGDIDWLLKMAEKEDGSFVSVGGLVAAIEERECGEQAKNADDGGAA